LFLDCVHVAIAVFLLPFGQILIVFSVESLIGSPGAITNDQPRSGRGFQVIIAEKGAGMGDKGGKKDKGKNKQQQLTKQKQAEQKKHDKAPAKKSVAGTA
jgi:hypothetical protein